MKRCVLMILCCAASGAALGEVYATAELGYASADFNLGSPYNGVVDDRAMTLGAEIGFSIKRRFAVELGVNKYSSLEGRATPCAPGAVCPNVVVPTGSNDVFAYSIALIPHIELDNVVLFAEFGYYHADIDTEIGIPGDDFTEDGVIAGVGARWYFKHPWSVSLETSRLDDNIYQVAFGVGWGVGPGADADEDDVRAARPR
jgi:outer membrane protein with beta-barrel domain